MKKLYALNFLLMTLLLVGCRSGSTSSSTTVPTSGGSQSPTTSGEKTSIPTTTKKATLVVSGETFGARFSAGTQFSNNEHAENNAALAAYLNETGGDSTLVKSIDSEGCASQFANKKVSTTGHLTFGSQKAIGAFTINTNYFIKEIKVNVQVYYSYYEDYQNPGSYIYNVDVGAKLKIESEEFTLQATEGEETIPEDKTYILSEPNQSITLGNVETDSHRVYINSIELTYYA